MKSVIVIPARMGSSRFPGKPLAPIAGVSLLERVYHVAKACRFSDNVIIATDHEKIAEHAHGFGADVQMTSVDCKTGTDRAAEVLNKRPEFDVIFNLQGDAPLTPPWIIDAVLQELQKPEVQLATPAVQLSDEALKAFIARKQAGSTTGTTVVFNRHRDALYFSKQVLPFAREGYFDAAGKAIPVFQHIGLYGYKKSCLLQLAALEQTPLEKIEQLEQLRALENGIPIRVVSVDYRGRTPASVDRPEDVAIVETILAKEGEIV